MYDLTLQTYATLCREISFHQEDCRFLHYIEDNRSTIILRHDVDRKPKNALRMAKLESELGVKATYYFRSVPTSFDTDIIRRISAMGHEIGYHYEVMSKANGIIDMAKEFFNKDLERMRSICEVSTACMHGSPISREDNRNFWDDVCLSDFGLLGEAYANISPDFNYYTDTGGSWNGRDNVRDRVKGCPMPSVQNTADILANIRSGARAYISCHPERWAESPMEIPLYRTKDKLMNLGKKLFRHPDHT